MPLGGLGHVGGNMMVYETVDDLIVVDCGILFPTADQPGVDYIIPDISYVLDRRDKLRAYILTHGHEDHLGALPYVFPEAPAPVYGTPFTLALLQNKLTEHPDLDLTTRPMNDREPFTLGDFRIDPIPVTHSIPQAVALAIWTPAGCVVHTGDFKLDAEPLDGRMTDLDAFRALGESGVTALLSDSTNAERSGHTWGERQVAGTLEELITGAPRRVFVTTFASHMHRIQTLLDASHRAGRKVMPVGRSVTRNIQLGLEKGILKTSFAALRDPTDFDKIRPEHLTVIASGSQGEPRSAMTRIAAGQHGHVRIEPGDRIILSSRRIPGNERAIGKMVNNMWRLGADVIDDRLARVHASGHAFNDEQRHILDLCRPRFFVPIHGEYRHLVRHASIARQAGVAEERIFVIEDGQPLELTRNGDTVDMRRGEPVSSGHVFVDGKGIGDVGEIVLRDRRVLAKTGIVLCVVILGDDGSLVDEPHIVTRGVIHVDANPELMERAVACVRQLFEGDDPCVDVNDCSEQVRLTLRRFFRRELDRRPLILPVIMEL
ncbi:MAG: ribonuclease J [Myxococcota bacterium]